MSVHANCTHPATKSARAACRRDSKNFPGMKLATTTDPGSYAFQDELEREMARTAVYTGPAQVDNPEEYDRIAALIKGDETKTHVVTRSTWKGYREITVEIDVKIWGAQPDSTVTGKIVAWGEKRLTYVSATGARNNLDTERVKAVRALMTNV